MSQDTVTLGGLKIKDVTFGEATHEGSISFVVARFAGILGMGFQAISVDKIPPVFYLMYQQKLVQDYSYSFYLTKTAGAIGSKLILGGVSSEYASSDFHYNNVTHETYWFFNNYYLFLI